MQSIIFFDIDGTIMTEDERMIIPESTVSAIAETRRKGKSYIHKFGQNGIQRQ